jgi:hypothetical protein
MSLELSAPHPITFFISVIVVVVAVVIHYGDTPIPYVHSGFVVLRRRECPWRIVKASIQGLRAPGPLWCI